MNSSSARSKKKNYGTLDALSTFAIGLLVLQIITLLLFAIFIRMKSQPVTDVLEYERMLGFFAANMMAVGGFGLFLSFGVNYQFTPMGMVLLTMAVTWQLYVLMYPFWLRLLNGFSNYGSTIELDMKMIIRASRCSLSAVVALTAVLGRLSFKDLLKILPLFAFGYACNESII
jgi:hypothetical protein